MTSPTRGCWARFLAGAIVALVATVGVAPSTARAGCSHYVVSRSDRAAGMGHLELLQLADGELASTIPAVPPPRCSGPMCSGGTPVAPSTPATPNLVRAEQWGCLTTFAPLGGRGLLSFLDAEDPARPVRRTCSIDRPPRPSIHHAA